MICMGTGHPELTQLTIVSIKARTWHTYDANGWLDAAKELLPLLLESEKVDS